MHKLFWLSFLLLACTNQAKEDSQAAPIDHSKKIAEDSISCTEAGCNGTYQGPEFVKGADIAHQFSNKVSEKVGEQLKELYRAKQYSKVDFSKVKMSTKGMGSGYVIYQLYLPFKRVVNECDAYTSFDHSGGWNHKPAIQGRRSKLKKALLLGDSLNISQLKTTPEGLQEYWIQWKNQYLQIDCI